MEWINVSDRFPKLYQEVIICSDEGRVKAATYLGNSKWNTFLNVVWWMSLPEAPEINNNITVEEEQPKKRGRKKKEK